MARQTIPCFEVFHEQKRLGVDIMEKGPLVLFQEMIQCVVDGKQRE